MESASTQTLSATRLTLIIGVSISFVFLIGGLVLQGVGLEGGPVDPGGMLEIGVMFLMATPIVRVLVLAVGFVRERELTFALVAFCILLLLSASVAIGLAGE